MAITRVADTAFSSGAYGWAFAPNIIGLKGLTTEDKYVLQVWNSNESEKLADIRVDANQEGLAYFDIQTILQSHVESKTKPIDLTTVKPFIDSSEETAELVIKFGSETDGVVTIAGLNNKIRISRQRNLTQYQDAAYLNTLTNDNPQSSKWIDSTQYPSIPEGTVTGSCTGLSQVAQTQTDWSYYKLGSEITDGKPYWTGEYSDIPVLIQEVTRNKNGLIPFRSVSVYNNFTDVQQTISAVKGCEGVVITEFDGDTQINDTIYYNILSNGGGPNASVGAGSTIQSPYNYITFNWSDAVSNHQFDQDTTHFYVSFMVGTGAGCGDEIYNKIHEQAAWLVHRYNVVEQCNDYSPFTLMWLNSKGFYDYFQFNKKHEELINIQRNPYLAGEFNYNRGDIGVGAVGTNKRGTTNYSQKMVRQITLTTDYLEDYESTYLQNLLKSPEVYYIDQDNWYEGRYDNPSNPKSPIACQLVTNTYTEKTYRKNKLFQLQINIQDSFNLNSQRG